MDKISICVIGAGNWGNNHIKTLNSMNVKIGCVDTNDIVLKKIKKKYENVNCYTSFEHSLTEQYDGYIIATPPISHFELAKLVISHNKPVLVEKPLSLTLKESKEIKSQLIKNNGKLVAGHLLLFHPAIRKIKALINEGLIGKIQYIYSNRLNLGIVRKEENVFWSLAPHDISIFQFLTDSFPLKVQSLGGCFLQDDIHDTTITYLKYPSGIQGHIYVSWLHPFKEHRLVIIGSKGSFHFEDSAQKKELLFYENDKTNIKEPLKLKNKNSIHIKFDSSLPLSNELEYFLRVIKGEPVDIANIDQGIEVVKILEMATKSLS